MQKELSWQIEVENNDKKIWLLAFLGFDQKLEELRRSSFSQHYNYIIVALPDLESVQDHTCYSIFALCKEVEKTMYHLNIQQVDLLGFSIGTRLAYALFSESPELFKRIYFIAPDTFVNYKRLPLLTRFLKTTKLLNNTKRAAFFVRLSKTLGLLHNREKKYILSILQNQKKCTAMLLLWDFMCQCSIPPTQILKKLSNTHEISFFFGTKDKIVNQKLFPSSLYSVGLIKPLYSGHFTLFARAAAFISQNFKDTSSE